MREVIHRGRKRHHAHLDKFVSVVQRKKGFSPEAPTSLEAQQSTFQMAVRKAKLHNTTCLHLCDLKLPLKWVGLRGEDSFLGTHPKALWMQGEGEQPAAGMDAHVRQVGTGGQIQWFSSESHLRVPSAASFVLKAPNTWASVTGHHHGWMALISSRWEKSDWENSGCKISRIRVTAVVLFEVYSQKIYVGDCLRIPDLYLHFTHLHQICHHYTFQLPYSKWKGRRCRKRFLNASGWGLRALTKHPNVCIPFPLTETTWF